MNEALLIFCLVSFVGIVTPGPTVLLALSNGSRLGVRASLPGMAGAVLSDFVLISAVALGLGALLLASQFWFSALKWVGVVYLAWLGLRMLRSRGTLTEIEVSGRSSSYAVFSRSFLVAVTNPKGYLLFAAFLPQFIDPAAPQFAQYATLAITFAAIDFAVMLAYAAAGAQAIRLLRARGLLWLDRFCGATLLALSASLALYRKQA